MRNHINMQYHRINRRASDGRFSDDDLAGIIQDSTERRAGAFQARGTPRVLRIVEIMGIEQARSWGVCTVRVASTKQDQGYIKICTDE